MSEIDETIARALPGLEQRAAGLGPVMREYFAYHRPRFAQLAGVVAAALERVPDGDAGPRRLLDVGPSFQTDLFQELWPDLRIDTFGFHDPRWPGTRTGVHHGYDLNDAYDPAAWPQLSGYHAIVFAEVIEHLYTSPTQVLPCLASFLLPGGFLVVQTPNAVSLRKRVLMLGGRNPYELIRETRDNPGHFREYTGDELRRFGEESGLTVESLDYFNYTGSRGALARLWLAASPVLPRSLRRCITAVYRKPGA